MIKKQNIVIGVCGFGKGHTVRQKNIIEELLKRGHKILLFLTPNNKDFFSETFPEVGSYVVHIPWIYTNRNGIQFKETKERYVRDNKDWYMEQLSAFVFAEEYFNNQIDIVISDYEPNSAQLSYAKGIPLICLEQQSKFLGFNTPELGDFSRVEEAGRLNYFFPIANKRIVSSFFDLPGEKIDKTMEVIPPIINTGLEMLNTERKQVHVYFSPYNIQYKKFPQMLSKLEKLEEFKFLIYSNDSYDRYSNVPHFIFKKMTNSEDFLFDLRRSEFVISTSGHQLISEAIWYEKPLFLIPFETYEQKFNTYMVEKYALGKNIEGLNLEQLRDAFQNFGYHKKQMVKYKKKYWKRLWNDDFFCILEREFNL